MSEQEHIEAVVLSIIKEKNRNPWEIAGIIHNQIILALANLSARGEIRCNLNGTWRPASVEPAPESEWPAPSYGMEW